MNYKNCALLGHANSNYINLSFTYIMILYITSYITILYFYWSISIICFCLGFRPLRISLSQCSSWSGVNDTVAFYDSMSFTSSQTIPNLLNAAQDDTSLLASIGCPELTCCQSVTKQTYNLDIKLLNMATILYNIFGNFFVRFLCITPT